MLKTICKIIICIPSSIYAAGCIGTAIGCIMQFIRATKSPTLTPKEINSLGKPLQGAITGGIIGAFLIVAEVVILTRW